MKRLRNFGFVVLCAFCLSSCYSYKSMVGSGPVEFKKDSKVNNYFLFGLVPGKTSNSKKLAAGAVNYEIHTRQTFGNYVVMGLTLGLYTPTKTTVTR